MARERSIEEIAWLIATAFMRQVFPLTEEGRALRERIGPMVATRLVPVSMIDVLPTVENPRLELFRDFDLTPEQELEVFGWNLSTVQVCKGCTHR